MIDDDVGKEEVARRLNHSVRWLQAILAKDRKANYPPKLQFHHYIGRIPLWTESEFQSLKAALVAVADARHGRSERPAQPLSSAAVSGTPTVPYAKDEVAAASARVRAFRQQKNTVLRQQRSSTALLRKNTPNSAATSSRSQPL
jgi:hypothetical protein